MAHYGDDDHEAKRGHLFCHEDYSDGCDFVDVYLALWNTPRGTLQHPFRVLPSDGPV